MGTRIDSWRSEDGLIWSSEIECTTHECLKAVFGSIPALMDRQAIIRGNVELIALSLAPLARLLALPAEPVADMLDLVMADPALVYPAPSEESKTKSPEYHPEAEPENHPEDEGCDCGALMAGNEGSAHSKSCTSQTHNYCTDPECTKANVLHAHLPEASGGVVTRSSYDTAAHTGYAFEKAAADLSACTCGIEKGECPQHG